MRYCGLFYARNQQTLDELFDAPCHVLGRHALYAQEVAYDGGAIAFAYGRLRNEASLRAQLGSAGIPMESPGGLSALVLGAYRLWGDEYPRQLMGPVVTMVIDQDAQRLILSRDRMGELPLFYTYKGGSLAFADHPEALLLSGVARRVVDREGLCELFALGPARTPGLTPLRDVRQLLPGHTLIADAQSHRIGRYFELEAREHQDDEAQTIDTVRQLVEDAVSEILPLQPGCMLSGGLDSTVLSALLARHDAKLHTWSVDYKDNEHYYRQNRFQIERDTPFALRASQLLGTEHHEVTLDAAGLAEGLAPAMALRGLVGMGDIDSSLMLFAREIGKSHRYVVSGECGDEVFGGYPWFNRNELILSEGFPWSGSMALREHVLKRPLRDRLQLGRYAWARYHEAASALPRLAKDNPRDARLRQIHGLCFQWFMPNLQERAQCMCAGADLTVLTPFSDERLVQYLYNVPWAMKGMRGAEKGLLRAAMADLLPDDLLWRKKSPYPKTHHPEYAQRMRQGMMDILSDWNAPLRQLLNIEAVTALVQSDLRPEDTPWYGQLMTGAQMLAYLIQINEWLQRYQIEIDI